MHDDPPPKHKWNGDEEEEALHVYSRSLSCRTMMRLLPQSMSYLHQFRTPLSLLFLFFLKTVSIMGVVLQAC